MQPAYLTENAHMLSRNYFTTLGIHFYREECSKDEALRLRPNRGQIHVRALIMNCLHILIMSSASRDLFVDISSDVVKLFSFFLLSGGAGAPFKRCR